MAELRSTVDKIQLIMDYLEGRLCTVILFGNEPDGEFQWKMSTLSEPDICEVLDRKNVYNSLNLRGDLRKELKRTGGKVKVYFFDSTKNKEVVFVKGN